MYGFIGARCQMKIYMLSKSYKYRQNGQVKPVSAFMIDRSFSLLSYYYDLLMFLRHCICCRPIESALAGFTFIIYFDKFPSFLSRDTFYLFARGFFNQKKENLIESCSLACLITYL